jgi:hypothetical protein
MKFHFTFFISFDHGSPVIETLEKLHSEVADTLANFKSEFTPRRSLAANVCYPADVKKRATSRPLF